MYIYAYLCFRPALCIYACFSVMKYVYMYHFVFPSCIIKPCLCFSPALYSHVVFQSCVMLYYLFQSSTVAAYSAVLPTWAVWRLNSRWMLGSCKYWFGWWVVMLFCRMPIYIYELIVVLMLIVLFMYTHQDRICPHYRAAGKPLRTGKPTIFHQLRTTVIDIWTENINAPTKIRVHFC